MDWQAHRRDAHALGRTQEFLKQIIYGGNDGIVTTFAIVAGFAGASAEGVLQIGGLAVLVFGLANLFADAVSMGLGEFLSLRSQHDLYRKRRESELREIAENPDHERMELFEILRQRGVPPPEDDSPALSGLFTFLAFVVFGAVPLLPYFVMEPTPQAFWWSVATTFGALSALGLLRWNATGEPIARSVGETILVGAVCAVVAYGVGLVVAG